MNQKRLKVVSKLQNLTEEAKTHVTWLKKPCHKAHVIISIIKLFIVQFEHMFWSYSKMLPSVSVSSFLVMNSFSLIHAPYFPVVVNRSDHKIQLTRGRGLSFSNCLTPLTFHSPLIIMQLDFKVTCESFRSYLYHCIKKKKELYPQLLEIPWLEQKGKSLAHLNLIWTLELNG